jgi:hypothetical protein
MQSVTLDTIGSGALLELFQEELAKVIANINDPNTSEKSKRTISIGVVFKPKGRDQADVELTCSAKLAPIAKVDTQIFMGRQKGKLVAVENDPRQSTLFDEEKPRLAPVADIAEGRQ